jgi:hypothetical protein
MCMLSICSSKSILNVLYYIPVEIIAIILYKIFEHNAL